ncbi:MAG: acyltransferase [Planctomycetes bacterium]|nr:acyltransferase [Planctomycetota bacterium]
MRAEHAFAPTRSTAPLLSGAASSCVVESEFVASSRRTQRPSHEHVPALDGLRGVAVLLVLFGHAPLLLATRGSDAGGFWQASRGGWIGVDLFFVLSGFLITRILIGARGSEGAFRNFWLRRALRIFPLAYAYLALLAALAWLAPGFATLRDLPAFAWAASYLTNLHIALEGWTQPQLALLWSLAVEEHFYLLWPLAALALPRRALGLLLVAVLVGAPWLRWSLLDHVGVRGIYVLTPCRIDTLACGALLALAWDSAWRTTVQRAARWLALPAFACVSGVLIAGVEAVDPATPRWFHIGGFSAIAASFAVVCALALERSSALARALAMPALRAIGRISYGMYVWHALAALVVRHGLDRLGWDLGLFVSSTLWLFAVLLVASASYRWIEAPFLRWKDRIARRHPAAEIAIAPPASRVDREPLYELLPQPARLADLELPFESLQRTHAPSHREEQVTSS